MIIRNGIWLVILTFSVLISSLEVAAKDIGRFEGKLIVESLPDGRNLKVVQDFTYVDPSGVRWSVPAGITTDGASVPRFAWILYPPFAGKYRIASVVHDRYCQTRTRPWRTVHRMFYQAMLTAGVNTVSAKTMFAAVWAFGPKWLAGGSKIRSGSANLPLSEKKKQLRLLQEWIKRANPSPETIEEFLNKHI